MPMPEPISHGKGYLYCSLVNAEQLPHEGNNRQKKDGGGGHIDSINLFGGGGGGGGGGEGFRGLKHDMVPSKWLVTRSCRGLILHDCDFEETLWSFKTGQRFPRKKKCSVRHAFERLSNLTVAICC